MRVKTKQPVATTSVVEFNQRIMDGEPTPERAATSATGPTMFTVCEVAKILRLGKISVYQAIEKGEIPYLRIGRRILIPRYALERLLENLRPVPKPAA